MSEPATRTRLREHVAANPGVHFNELARRLDLADGQVQYHVRRLRDDGTVTATSLYDHTHYYPADRYDNWERRAIALLRRETARDVVLAVLAADPARPAAVTADLGIARSTLSWHVDRLTSADVLRKRRDDAGRVTLHAADPAATARLLDDVSPTLPERMVDRFDRLLDALLSGD